MDCRGQAPTGKGNEPKMYVSGADVGICSHKTACTLPSAFPLWFTQEMVGMRKKTCYMQLSPSSFIGWLLMDDV